MADTPCCAFCGKEVDPTNRRQTWHGMTGWERKGAAGGSDIALREKVDAYACATCIRRQQRGVAAGQGSLL